MSQRFSSSRKAKEYLIERIVAQAKQDGTDLSEIERKMLYFTESAWTLPDMAEVSAKFDQEYNQDEYEAKIGEVVRRVHETAGDADEETWNEAVAVLSSEDHYLLVLISPRLARGRAARPPGDRVKLILTAALVVAVLLIGMWIFAGHR
jgi:hypothetical protein